MEFWSGKIRTSGCNSRTFNIRGHSPDRNAD